MYISNIKYAIRKRLLQGLDTSDCIPYLCNFRTLGKFYEEVYFTFLHEGWRDEWFGTLAVYCFSMQGEIEIVYYAPGVTFPSLDLLNA